MAYLEQTDSKILDDINKRKEFAIYTNVSLTKSKDQEIVPRFILENVIGKEHGLTLHSYQKFVANFMNPNTPYTRLFLQWSPGMGKTIASLSLALKFINYYNKEQESSTQTIGSVWIVGFSESIFKADLMKFPEFGFITEVELQKLNRLKELAQQGSAYDLEKINELRIMINRRLSNRKGNGFFKFIGYKSLLNRLFLSRRSDIVLTNLSETKIAELILDGTVILNKELANEMKNSLIICDEIHNVYNSAEKNNWGVALQTILNYDSTIRAVFLSATPFNNSPTELIDLLNLITSRKDFPEFKRADFFTKDEDLIENKIPYLREILTGRVSFITNNDSRYFPAKGFIGESIPGIDYLKFIRCPMSKFQYNTYKSAYTEHTLGAESQYVIDFALPNPKLNNPWNDIGIYKTSDIRSVYNHVSPQWRNKYKLFYNNDVLSGNILNMDTGSLQTISTKYYKMMKDIINIVQTGRGKIFIYHNVIHMSGVLFIGEILKANGFINELDASNDNTRCSVCGRARKEHKKEQLIEGGRFVKIPNTEINVSVYTDGSLSVIFDPLIKYKDNDDLDLEYIKNLRQLGIPIIAKIKDPLPFKTYSTRFKDFIAILPSDSANLDDIQDFIETTINSTQTHGGNATHKYIPARYTLVHSNISRKVIDRNRELFNSVTNCWGEHIMILVGARIMRESVNLMCVQNLFIVGRPDNIPTMLQINGRAIRTNSHIMLPPKNRLVTISVYTSCLPNKELSYEEIKYKEKIKSFKTIQKLELLLHEMAIDKAINYNIIFQPISDIQKKQHYELDILPYSIGKTKKYTLSELNLETFNAYYADDEIKEIKFLIKKIFIEISPVWTYDHLFQAIKSNKFTRTNYDMELISEHNFIIALNSLLIKDSDKYVEPHIQKISDNEQLYYRLHDHLDKYIYMVGGQIKGIKHIGEHYMLMPIINNEIVPDIETPYRTIAKNKDQTFTVKNYLLHDLKTNYENKKLKFLTKWEHVELRNLELAICDYGTNFHRQFAEECIQYMFNIWTNPKQVKSRHHVFYIKMLYYYDLRKVIIWAHTVSDKIFAQYKEWAIPIVQKLQRGLKIDKIKDTHLNSTSGLINLLKTSINKNNTAWVSTGMVNDFTEKVKYSLSLYDGNVRKKNAKTKINADYLPIGHYIGQIPRFYNPNKGGWYDDMSYLEYTMQFKENNIIIGYDDKSKTGINVKFKLRNPIQNIKQYKDTRQIEKGSICLTKSKQYLRDIAKRLDIQENQMNKDSVEDLCMKIRTRLIYYELKARSSGSNIKYFYFLHEVKPETMLGQ